MSAILDELRIHRPLGRGSSINQLLKLLNTDSKSQKRTQILLKQISNLLDAPDRPHNPIFLKYGVVLLN